MEKTQYRRLFEGRVGGGFELRTVLLHKRGRPSLGSRLSRLNTCMGSGLAMLLRYLCSRDLPQV